MKRILTFKQHVRIIQKSDELQEALSTVSLKEKSIESTIRRDQSRLLNN